MFLKILKKDLNPKYAKNSRLKKGYKSSIVDRISEHTPHWRRYTDGN